MSTSKSSVLPAVLLVVVAVFSNGLRIDGNSQFEDGPQSCHLREMDLCATMALSFLQNPNGIPVNDAEIDKQCGFLNEAEKCVDGFMKRCFESQNQALMEMFFGDARKVKDDFCTNGTSLRETYKKFAPCMAENQKKLQQTCLTDLQVGFEAIHKARMFQRIQLGCCNLNRFQHCIYKDLAEQCGKESVEFVEGVLDRAMSRMPRVFCREYDQDSRRCLQILPPIGTTPHVGRNTSSISRLLSTYSAGRQF